jgi:hypothetical protein
MSIPIITNFQVNSPTPIDSRMVVTNSSARESLLYKYAGMKVYQLDNGLTYVYNTNSQWVIDGINSSGGIYGGSGSLTNDVGVGFGTVNNTVEDRGYSLYYHSDSPTDGDKNHYQSYFYRRINGNDYDTMSFRQEQKLAPTGGSILQGPYIEYNGIVPNFNSVVGSLIFGVGNSNLSTRLPKLVISPLNHTNFYFTDNPETEETFAITRFQDETYLGYNYAPNLPDVIASSQNISKPSYRIKFGSVDGSSSFDIDTRKSSSFSYNTAISIDNNLLPNESSSTVKLLVDNSSRDWDGVTGRNSQLHTPQEIIRNIEHKYVKTQMWGQGTVNSLTNGILFLNTDGNSYTISLNANEQIKNIKAYKSNTFSPDFPNGTILTIKFINSVYDSPASLKIFDGINDSKIISDLTDANFERNDKTKLTIYHDTSMNESGDIMTLRRSDEYWEIINISRERKITDRIWSKDGESNIGVTDIDWTYSDVFYFDQLNENGRFLRYNESLISHQNSIGNPPNKFSFLNGLNGPTRESINSDGFDFRISVDGNRIVFIQGNFNINLSSPSVGGDIGVTNFFYYNQNTRENVWRIGKINNVKLLPMWETSWTFCSGYCVDDLNSPIDLSEMMFSINRVGEIFLKFKAISTTTRQNDFIGALSMDVWIPPFSYIAATGVSLI